MALLRYQRIAYEPEARIVRRIWAMYADGLSPVRICHILNQENIPAPGSRWHGKRNRGKWGPSAIYGNPNLGTGILHNRIYVGKLVWNKFAWERDPDTETRKPRLRPAKGWVTVDAPKLRIIPEALYQRVQARLTAIRKSVRSLRGVESWKAMRPTYLLSGLAKCGRCGASYIIYSRGNMLCASHLNRGPTVCTNSLVVSRDMLEREVLGTLIDRVLSQSSLNDLIKTITAGMRNRASQQPGNRQEIPARLKDVEASIAHLVDHLEAGTVARDVIEQRLAERQQERDVLTRELKRQPVSSDGEKEAKKVERLLRKVLNPLVLRMPNLLTGKKQDVVIRDIPTLLKLLYSNVAKNRAVLETLIDGIVIHPLKAGVEFELRGNLGRFISRFVSDDAGLPFLPEKETVPVQSAATPNGTDSRSADSAGSGGRI